ncbi:hypothetical protein IK146_01315 [Candidatus Saccharibacteria bacterium]|nr:hypothetical protein [Candidatus Saccharibacteria bacterium]
MFKRFPVISRLIVAAIVLALLGLLIWGGWTLAYNQGWVSRAPTWDFASLLEPNPTDAPPERTIPEVTEPPAQQATNPPPADPTPEPTAVLTPEPTAVLTPQPTAVPTPEPTPVPTPTPAPQVVFAPTGKTASFTIDNQTVTLETFTYSGGWLKGSDPWFIAKNSNLAKEVPEAFGMPISGDEWAMRTTNWLKAAVSDPWTLTWFRFQMHLEDFKNMDEVNQYADKLANLPSGEYDKIANEALTKFFKKINGGRGEVDPNWELEVMLREPGEGKILELFGRKYSDSNNTPDLVVTFYAKGEETSFVSYKGAWKVAAAAAGVNANSYRARAYINLTEGGTWKWKTKGGGGTPPSEEPTPTPAPTPTKKPRPTKDPSQRPTVSDAPIGGGETDPQHSADPHTTDHVESTPTPSTPTATPEPTAEPTPVPTAVVRPTEVCQTEAPPPIREDQNTPPPSDPGHNVPTEKPTGTGDDTFDPNSV